MKMATFMLVVTNLWKGKMEICIVWKSGTARKSSLNLVTSQAKAKEEGRVKLTKTVSAVTSMEDHPKYAPKGKSVGKF